MRVLELMDEKTRGQALQDDEPDRRGIFTSNVLSIGQGHSIALFFTGPRHAGENLREVCLAGHLRTRVTPQRLLRSSQGTGAWRPLLRFPLTTRLQHRFRVLLGTNVRQDVCQALEEHVAAGGTGQRVLISVIQHATQGVHNSRHASVVAIGRHPSK